MTGTPRQASGNGSEGRSRRRRTRSKGPASEVGFGITRSPSTGQVITPTPVVQDAGPSRYPGPPGQVNDEGNRPVVGRVIRDFSFGFSIFILIVIYFGHRIGFHAHFHLKDTILNPNHEMGGLFAGGIAFLTGLVAREGGQTAANVMTKTLTILREFLTQRD